MIYLDYNATTPVDHRVVEAMVPLLRDTFANPASDHKAGRAVAETVEAARAQVASLVGTNRRNVVFTSGATESAYLAISGAVTNAPTGRRRILVAATEHSAVLAAADRSAHAGAGTVERIRVRRDGTVDLEHADRLLDQDVAVVAVMSANNETGVINDIGAVGEVAHRYGALMCSDLTQTVGKLPVHLDEWPVDLAFWSSHKMYGPKGVGALAADRLVRRRLTPPMPGGGQERGLRGGTLNSPGIVGFGQASAIAQARLESDHAHQSRLACLLWTLLTPVGDVELNSTGAPRLANTLNIRFAGAPAQAVQTLLPDVCVSTGSACRSQDTEPSPVLLAMGLTAEQALESLRFSLGRDTTELDVRTAAARVANAVNRVRELGQAQPGRAHLLAPTNDPLVVNSRRS